MGPSDGQRRAAAGRWRTPAGSCVTTPLLEWTAAQIAALRGDWPAAAAAVQTPSSVTSEYEMMVIPTLLARAQIAEAEADYAKVRGWSSR